MMNFEIKPGNRIHYCIKRTVNIKGTKVYTYFYVNGETGLIDRVEIQEGQYVAAPDNRRKTD